MNVAHYVKRTRERLREAAQKGDASAFQTLKELAQFERDLAARGYSPSESQTWVEYWVLQRVGMLRKIFPEL